MERIGHGRSAEIYALNDATVLRRVRPGRDAVGEARLLTYLREAGYPVPEVLRVDGRDLVMERVPGPDLFTAVREGRLDAAESMRILGGLAARLVAVPPPEWLAIAPDADVEHLALAHLDLHHENVLLGANGPVVIDWEGARRADRALDVAMTCVVLLTDPKPRDALGDAVPTLVREFVRASGIDPAPAMERAVRRRLRDRNLSDDERAVVARLLPAAS